MPLVPFDQWQAHACKVFVNICKTARRSHPAQVSYACRCSRACLTSRMTFGARIHTAPKMLCSTTHGIGPRCTVNLILHKRYLFQSTDNCCSGGVRSLRTVDRTRALEFTSVVSRKISTTELRMTQKPVVGGFRFFMTVQIGPNE